MHLDFRISPQILSDHMWNVLFHSEGFSDERQPEKLKLTQRS